MARAVVTISGDHEMTITLGDPPVQRIITIRVADDIWQVLQEQFGSQIRKRVRSQAPMLAQSQRHLPTEEDKQNKNEF